MRLVMTAIMLTVVTSTSVAQAGPLGWLIEDMKTTFHRNNCWPEPFVYPDRAHVNAPFEAMTQRGWEQQNMLGPQHFEDGSAKLSEAGRIKLRWIMTQAPAQYRTAFVERDADPKLTAERIAATRQLADQIVQGGGQAIQETALVSHGASGAYFDSVYQKFQTSTPEPRLPASSGDADTGN